MLENIARPSSSRVLLLLLLLLLPLPAGLAHVVLAVPAPPEACTHRQPALEAAVAIVALALGDEGREAVTSCAVDARVLRLRLMLPRFNWGSRRRRWCTSSRGSECS
jgi:hypothetical protein